MSGHLNSNFTALHTIYINYCPYLLIFQRSFKISSFIIITEGERNTLLFPTRDFRIFCPLRLSLDWMFLGVGTVSHRSLSFPPLPWCQGQCFLFFFLIICLFMHAFVFVLGLPCYAWTFSVARTTLCCRIWFLVAVASLIVAHRL